MTVNDALYARELALAGLGLAYLFAPLVAEDIAAGRLEAVLPAASIEEPGLFLYFPRGAAAAPKLRAFIDVARGVSGRAGDEAADDGRVGKKTLPPRNRMRQSRDLYQT